jgi:putative membrane protein
VIKELLLPETAAKFEHTITEVESLSSAEVVVALAFKSGEYRDVPYLWGIILALASLLFMVIGPLHFGDLAIIPDLVLFFFLGYVVSLRAPQMGRLLTTSKRRDEQVRNAALVAFYEDGVTATKERNGIFFYFSAFERQVEILPDLGVDGRIARGEWNTLRHQLNAIMKAHGTIDQLLEKFKEAGNILGQAYPPREDKVNEIPNRPKVRL